MFRLYALVSELTDDDHQLPLLPPLLAVLPLKLPRSVAPAMNTKGVF